MRPQELTHTLPDDAQDGCIVDSSIGFHYVLIYHSYLIVGQWPECSALEAGSKPASSI